MTNFFVDKKAWPVYLKIGNMCSQTRNSPSKIAVILVALLPVPPKFTSKKTKTRGAQQTMIDKILDAVFSFIFEPLNSRGCYAIRQRDVLLGWEGAAVFSHTGCLDR